MAANIYLVDLADIRQMVFDELKLDPSDTNEVTRINRDINAVYQDEVVPFKRWPWLSGHFDIQTTAFSAYGTASVTPSSTTVTLTAAPPTSVAGYKFATDQFDEVYEVASHTGGSTTLTLTQPWNGALGTLLPYKLWVDIYALPTDMRETTEIWHDFMKEPMTSLGLQDFRRRVSESPRASGRPLLYTTVYDKIPVTGSDRQRFLRVFPSVYQNATTLHGDYIKHAPALQLDGDEPLIPLEDRIVLVYGALSRAWRRARNPEEAANNHTLYQQKLARMAGKLEDSTDRPSLSPDSEYLARKRQKPNRGTMSGPFNAGGSYTAPTYLKNPVIEGAQLTATVTASPGVTVDGRDISVDGIALDQHLSDLASRHLASQIQSTPVGTVTATNVDSAISQLQTGLAAAALATDLTAHITNASGAHAASAISNTPTGLVTSTSVQGAINELQTHINATLPLAGGTLTGAIALPSGALGTPSLTFSGDLDTGIYRVGTNEIAIVAGGHAGLDIKDNGSFANLGMGGTASASSNYPLLLQRSNTSTGTIVQVSNPDNSAFSKATYQLSTDLGSNTGEVSVFTAATTLDAYAGRMTVRASDSTSGVSIIAGDGATNGVRVYTGGDYTSAGKALEVTSEKAVTLPQSVAPASVSTPSSGLSLHNHSGVLKSKNSSGTARTYTTLDGTEALTNKDIDGGTASNSSRLTLPKAAKTTLDALARKEATIVYDTTGQKAYIDNGTSLVAIGSGSGTGGVEYITNTDAETDTSGYSTYNNTAGTAPTTGTGGSPSITWTRSTSSPLRGNASFLLTKGATNRQGDGVSIPFTISAADQGRILAINCDYQIASGTFATGDLAWYVYDVTNAVVIQPSAYQVVNTTLASQMQQATFQTASNSTSYRLCLHVASASTSAYTLKFDSISVGPQVKSTGPAVIDLGEYTPSFTGLGTVSNLKAHAYRIGPILKVIASWTNGTVTATNVTVTIPTGLAIDVTSVATSGNTLIAGKFQNTAGSGDVIAYTNNTTTDKIIAIVAASNAIATGSGNFVSSGGSAVTFEVPIQGWSSSQVLSQDAGTRLIAAKYYSTTAQALTAGTRINFDVKSYDKSGAVTTGVSTWAFTAQEAGVYVFIGQVYAGSTSSLRFFKNGTQQNYVGGQGLITTFNESFDLVAGDVIDIRAQGTFTLDTTAPYDNYISMFKLNSPQQIAVTESISCKYTSSVAQAISGSGTTVLYGTKMWDSHGSYNPSTGIFTAPAPGEYQINARILCTSRTYATGNILQIDAVSSTGQDHGDRHSTEGAFTDYLGVAVTARRKLLTGQTWYITAISTATGNLHTDGDHNYVEIARVGTY